MDVRREWKEGSSSSSSSSSRRRRRREFSLAIHARTSVLEAMGA